MSRCRSSCAFPPDPARAPPRSPADQAETAEHLSELRGELKYLRRIFDEVLKGHATHGPNDFDQCSCTGCEIARRTGLRLWLDVDNERHETLGAPVRSPMPWTDGEVPF